MTASMIIKLFELFLANSRAPWLLLRNKCQNQHFEGGMQEGWKEVAEVGGDVGARSQGFHFLRGGG